MPLERPPGHAEGPSVELVESHLPSRARRQKGERQPETPSLKGAWAISARLQPTKKLP